MPALLLSLLSNILPSVISRVLPPEKISAADAAKIQSELQNELLKQDWQQIEAEYKDRDSARQLAAQDIAKGNALTGILAATVRPVWGFGAFALIAWSVIQAAPITPELQAVVQTVLYFYFGGRTIEKVAPLIAGVIKK